MIVILGIESTCDETAAAIIEEDNNREVKILGHIIASQIDEHVDYGGVVPELAARSHLNNIQRVISEVFKEAGVDKNDLNAIAASFAPGLIGGILTGNLFAKTMCSVLKKPFLAINHLEAHILMPLMNNKEIKYPFLAVLVSGGNTQIILVNDFEQYKILGKTIDDSIGETFDKVALMLGMKYPGGPMIEKTAVTGDCKKFKFPMPLCTHEYRDDVNFSFSGLKTHIKLLIDKQSPVLEEQFISDVCASFQYTISQILINRIENSIKLLDISVEDIIMSGGVSANKYLRNGLINHFSNHKLYFPRNDLCTDNGVMIAYNGLLKYKRGFFETLDSEVVPNISL